MSDPAIHDFFRFIKLYAEDGVTLNYTIEADSVTDSINLLSSPGVKWSDVQDSAYDQIQLDVDYQLYVPPGTTTIRLEDVNNNSREVNVVGGPGITIYRRNSGEIEVVGNAIAEIDTLHSVTNRGTITSNHLRMGELSVGVINSQAGVDGFSSVDVRLSGTGTLTSPVVFQPQDRETTSATYNNTYTFSSVASDGVLSYTFSYLSDANISSGSVTFEREDPASPGTWTVIDSVAGIIANRVYQISGNYAESNTGVTNYRVEYNFTGNTGSIAVQLQASYEVLDIVEDAVLVSDSANGKITVRDVVPAEDLQFDIGTPTEQFANVYANNFIGNFKGTFAADDSTIIIDGTDGTISAVNVDPDRIRLQSAATVPDPHISAPGEFLVIGDEDQATIIQGGNPSYPFAMANGLVLQGSNGEDSAQKTAAPGIVRVKGGNSALNTGNAILNRGGLVLIDGGESSYGTGGSVSITGGQTFNTNSDSALEGGNVEIIGGRIGINGLQNGTGGSVYIDGGENLGTGDDGSVIIGDQNTKELSVRTLANFTDDVHIGDYSSSSPISSGLVEIFEPLTAPTARAMLSIQRRDGSFANAGDKIAANAGLIVEDRSDHYAFWMGSQGGSISHIGGKTSAFTRNTDGVSFLFRQTQSGSIDAGLIEFEDTTTTETIAIGSRGNEFVVLTGNPRVTRLHVQEDGGIGINNYGTNTDYQFDVNGFVRTGELRTINDTYLGDSALATQPNVYVRGKLVLTQGERGGFPTDPNHTAEDPATIAGDQTQLVDFRYAGKYNEASGIGFAYYDDDTAVGDDRVKANISLGVGPGSPGAAGHNRPFHTELNSLGYSNQSGTLKIGWANDEWSATAQYPIMEMTSYPTGVYDSSLHNNDTTWVAIHGKLAVTNSVDLIGGITVQGATTLESDLSINDGASSNVFQVQAETGDTDIQGDLQVFGATTLENTKINNLFGFVENMTTLAGATGVVDHDTDTASVFYHSAISNDFTANFTNVPTTNGKAHSYVLVLDQSTVARLPTNVSVNGVSQTINWQDGLVPSGNANEYDVVGFTVLRDGGGNWIVFGSLTNFS